MRLAACLMMLASVGLVGCGTRQSKGTLNLTVKAVEDPWPGSVAGLRKETTPGGIGRVLGELTAATSSEPRFAAESLPATAEAQLKSIGRLTEDDLKQLRPTGFSSLDPHYVAECLYLRDCARVLELDGLPPTAQAEKAFAWVCRQVVLDPWKTAGRASGDFAYFPPAPPEFVLRKGSGSGLERAYVMLALAQQAGLDAVLIGPPAAADKDWKADPQPKPSGPPHGPFWAVGVRAGGDILLFDPWRGAPFTVPGGKGTLTLAQATATPELAKEAVWPAEAVKASVPFVSRPLPAFAPRFKRLEGELKADATRLYTDLPSTLKAFADATKTDPKFWNPGDPFAYPRVLAGFVPPAEGGASPNPNLQPQFKLSQLPQGLLRFDFVPGLMENPNDPNDLGSPDGVQALRMEAVNRIGSQFLTDPSPRERVQRGLSDGVKLLVELRDVYQKAQERLRTDRDRDVMIRDWVKSARDGSRRIAAARDRNPAALAAAESQFQQFLKETARAVSAIADLAVADVGMGETTYQIALAKHEQAVREQGRLARQTDGDRRKAADAWAEARDWWRRYEQYADAHDRAYPGRKEQAKRLAAEAAVAGS